MKKISTLLLSAFLLVGLMSCDNSTTEESNKETVADLTYTYQVNWQQQLNGSVYATGYANLVDVDGTEVVVGAGAMQQAAAEAGSLLSTESLFGTGNGYNLVTDGSGWGAVFAKFEAVDLSALTTAKIAIKGLPDTVTCITLQMMTEASVQDLNLRTFDSATSGEWTVYTVPFTSYDLCEFDAFVGILLGNPKSGLDTTAENLDIAIDVDFDIAFN